MTQANANEVLILCIHTYTPFLVAKAVIPQLSEGEFCINTREFYFPQVCYSEKSVTSVTILVITPVSAAENALLQ